MDKENMRIVVKINKVFQDLIDDLEEYSTNLRAERIRILCIYGLLYLKEKNNPNISINQSVPENKKNIKDDDFIETNQPINTIIKENNKEDLNDDKIDLINSLNF